MKKGLTLLEILIAIVFLAAGGLAIYTANQRSVVGSAWGAEHVLCEGLLNDLVDYFRTYTYDNLTTAQGVKQSPKPLEELLAEDVTLSEVDDLPVLDPGAAQPESAAASEVKGLKEAWQKVKGNLKIKRMVYFREEESGKRGVLTCIVKWRSAAGMSIESHRQVVVFKNS